MVKTPNSSHNRDEIDLLELLLRTIRFILDQKWLILFFFTLGAGLGITYFMLAAKQYESKMIISSNILTTSYAKVIFEKMNMHLREGDDAVLAKILNIDPQSVNDIASLQIDNLSQETQGELKESERYLITASVYDQSVLPALQKGIVNYLERNEFVSVRVEQQRQYLTAMVAAVEKELADIQQFKNDIYSGKFFTTAKGNVMFDPTSVNTKIIELTQKRMEFKNTLQLINSVQLIEGFTAFRNPKKPTPVTSVSAGIMIGLFVVGAFLAFKSISRLLRMAEAPTSKNAS